MESLSGPKLRETLEKVAVLGFLRSRTNDTEEVIAAKLEFGSPDAMYLELERLGLPPWLVRPEGGGAQSRELWKRRKARSVRGEAQELPPAKAAAPLFKEALKRLFEYVEFLEGNYERSSGRRYSKEYLQDRRFLQYTREEVLWAVPPLKRTWLTEGGRSPGNGLTELIAAYLLVFGDPEPLIEKLHYDPGILDRENLRRHIEGHRSPAGRKPGLIGSTQDVAILIRGGKLQSGAGPGKLNVAEQIAGQWIRQIRQEGASDEEIIQALSEEGISISRAEIGRLERLNLPDPSS